MQLNKDQCVLINFLAYILEYNSNENTSLVLRPKRRACAAQRAPQTQRYSSFDLRRTEHKGARCRYQSGYRLACASIDAFLGAFI
jgi:hypothetical protein